MYSIYVASPHLKFSMIKKVPKTFKYVVDIQTLHQDIEEICLVLKFLGFPANIYLFKVNKRNTFVLS